MRLRNLYDRLIADIRKAALDEDWRLQIQYRYILKILMAVVVISALINLFTERYTMGILMLILTVIYFVFYEMIVRMKVRGVKIVNVLIVVSSLLICMEVLIHGTTGGAAPIWILLFPILSCLLVGRKTGFWSSLLLLGYILFVFWTPFGRSFLMHDYEGIFLQRYPLVYLVMLSVSYFYETLRSIMVAELQGQRDQLEEQKNQLEEQKDQLEEQKNQLEEQKDQLEEQKDQLEEQKDQLERQKEQMESVYQNQYYSMTGRIAEARKIRHDLRHHFVMISQYLNDGKTEEALAYIKQYYEALPFEEALIYCEHYATNALLTYYVQNANKEGIKTEVKMHMPADLPIRTDDLTVVLGNLLENAVRACVVDMEENSSFQPELQVTGMYDSGSLMLSIENTSLREAKTNTAGQFISSKHEGLGIGIRSVAAIVEKYHGVLSIEQKDGRFCVQIMMYPTAA